MNISEYGIKFIQHHEGLQLNSYKCMGNFWTIGYGHKMTNNLIQKISVSEAYELLEKDLIVIIHQLKGKITIDLNSCQMDAIISFCFNLGVASFQRSTLRQKINYGDDFLVKKEFTRWIYAKGKIVRGLVIRRIHEAELFQGNKIIK